MATQAANPYKEAVDVVKEMRGDPLRLRYQCGLRSGACARSLLSSFIVHQLIHQAQLGLLLGRPRAHVRVEGRASAASWRRKTLVAAGAKARG